jgi:hypothetical protein
VHTRLAQHIRLCERHRQGDELAQRQVVALRLGPRATFLRIDLVELDVRTELDWHVECRRQVHRGPLARRSSLVGQRFAAVGVRDQLGTLDAALTSLWHASMTVYSRMNVPSCSR